LASATIADKFCAEWLRVGLNLTKVGLFLILQFIYKWGRNGYS